MIRAFEKALCREFNIYSWEISDEALRELAVIIASSDLTKQEIHLEIHKRASNVKCMILEGLDCSDLTTVLELATEISEG